MNDAIGQCFYPHMLLEDLARNYRSNSRSSPLSSVDFKKSEMEVSYLGTEQCFMQLLLFGEE